MLAKNTRRVKTMADINDYIKGLNYKFTEQEKLLMNIFAECWEHCNNRNSCAECEYANGNKNIKMLICISYQYAKRLIAADGQEVRHGKWIKSKNERKCSLCGYFYFTNTKNFNFCPNCGAKMYKE